MPRDVKSRGVGTGLPRAREGGVCPLPSGVGQRSCVLTSHARASKRPFDGGNLVLLLNLLRNRLTRGERKGPHHRSDMPNRVASSETCFQLLDVVSRAHGFSGAIADFIIGRSHCTFVHSEFLSTCEGPRRLVSPRAPSHIGSSVVCGRALYKRAFLKECALLLPPPVESSGCGNQGRRPQLRGDRDDVVVPLTCDPGRGRRTKGAET